MSDRPAEESLAIKNIERILASFKDKFARSGALVWEPAECESAARDIALVAQKVEDLSAFVYAMDLVGLAAAVVQDSEKGQAVHPLVNPAYCSLTGYTSEELEGVSLNRIGLMKDFAVLPQKTPGGKFFEMVIRTKSGEEVPVEMGLVERSYNGAPAKVIYLLDIHRRKKLEKEKEELRRNLENAQRERDIDRAVIGAMVERNTIIGHDMGTPITALSPLVEIPRDKIPDDVYEGMKAGYLRLCEYQQSLLNCRKGRSTDEIFIGDVKVLVSDAAALCVSKYNAAGVRLDCDIADDCKIKVRKTGFTSTLQNLLDNALEAVQDAEKEIGLSVKRVSIKCSRDAEAVVLSVSDTGIGMTAEDLSGLFKGISKKVKGRISGIGLLGVYSYVLENNGEIRAESDGIGKGATFYLKFPYAQQQPL